MEMSRNEPSSTSTFGLFFDTNNELRVLDPEVGQVTAQLTSQCQEFIEKSEKFEQVLQHFVEIVGKVASDVEIARMKALGSKGSNGSAAKRAEGIVALISERKKELDRIRVHRESLERSESDQNDLIASLNARVKGS